MNNIQDLSNSVKPEIKEQKGRDMSSILEVRVAVVGNVDSGKSTLIGVLTGGEKDDGRGGARQKVFVHRHELGTGRTSCISQHIMGYDDKTQPVYQPIASSASSAAKYKGWRKVVQESNSLVTYIDLAGHERYLKTTIAGLTGCFPDYAMIIINSLAGVSKMTKEHLGVVLALRIPVCCIVTKIDVCPPNVLERTKKQLFKILKSPVVRKMPIHVRSSKDALLCKEHFIAQSDRLTPVFFRQLHHL